MNEATLEARLHGVLEKLFPTFRQMKVVHQESFSIRFGHHAVTVDLKEPSKYPNRAIFDMLLTCGELNIMLVELKTEGHAITPGDIEQGLSYGRLIDPMPPLVLLSNGADNQLFDTYTKKPIDEASLDLDFIKGRIDLNFKLKTKEFAGVVNFLLNREPELIGKVFRGISKKNLERQMGGISELHKAIAPEFQIKRRIVRRLYRQILTKPGLFGLIGPAFSGKTCVLYQFFRNYGYQKDTYVLYADLKDWNYSLFQQLANAFQRETKGSVSAAQIREWLIDLLNNEDETRLVILLDNLQREIKDNLTAEILELIDLFDGSRHSIIYTLDEKKYMDLALIEERNYQSVIGHLTKRFLVTELNNREYNWVNQYLFKAVKVMIAAGGHLTSEYRELRILRKLAAASRVPKMDEGQTGKIYAIPDFHLYQVLGNNEIYTPAVRELYKKLAITFILDKVLKQQVREFGLLANSVLAVSKLNFVSRFGQAEFKKLIESGIVVERYYIKGFSTLIPKVQELIIIYTVDFLFLLIKADYQDKSFQEIFDYYYDHVSDIPAGDIVGAALLNRIGIELDIDLFTFMIQALTKIKPESNTISKGTKAVLFSQRHGLIDLDFEDDAPDDSHMGFCMAYAILAQLVYPPLESEDIYGKRSHDFYIDLLYTLGSEPSFLYRHGFGSLDRPQMITRETIPGWGEVLSEGNGIIETITQSLLRCFYLMPDLIEKLLDMAVSNLSKPLLWRLYLVFKNCLNVVDEDIAQRARIGRLKVQHAFFQEMTNNLLPAAKDEEEGAGDADQSSKAP